MSSDERIERLEIALVRLCRLMQRNTRSFPNDWTELELIKQYANGDLSVVDEDIAQDLPAIRALKDKP